MADNRPKAELVLQSFSPAAALDYGTVVAGITPVEGLLTLLNPSSQNLQVLLPELLEPLHYGCSQGQTVQVPAKSHVELTITWEAGKEGPLWQQLQFSSPQLRGRFTATVFGTCVKPAAGKVRMRGAMMMPAGLSLRADCGYRWSAASALRVTNTQLVVGPSVLASLALAVTE